MPYLMKYYYNGIDMTDDYINVNVYSFSLVDRYGAQALCYTVSDPSGTPPPGLAKGMWISAHNRYLIPII